MTDLSSTKLKELLKLRNQIDLLEVRFNRVANGASNVTRTGSRTMSTKGREAIAKAQRIRWAKFRKAKR